MPSLEERVGELETRVDQLEMAGEHTEGVALSSREAHRRNVELLNAIRATQAEHSRKLAEHDARFEAIEARLDAIETRLDTIEARLGAIEGTLGQVTLGMHTIEGLLRGMTDDD